MSLITPAPTNKIIKSFVRFIGSNKSGEKLIYDIVEKFGGEAKFVDEMNLLLRGEPDNFIKEPTVFDDTAVMILYKKNKDCIAQAATAFAEEIAPNTLLENANIYGGQHHGLSEDTLLNLSSATQDYNNANLAIFATRFVMHNIARLYGLFYQYQVDLGIYEGEV